MSGKFMNVKRIIIPTLTMIIITSQLMGCASVSQDEALNLLRQGDQIEIEIATPKDTVKEEKDTLPWEQLASLSTYSAFRSTFDTALGVVPTSDSSKNGIFHAFNTICRFQHKDAAHIFTSKSFRCKGNLYLITRYDRSMDNCRRIVFCIFPDQRIFYNRFS